MKGNSVARIIIWSVTAVLLTALLVITIVFDGFGNIFGTKIFSADVLGVKYDNSERYKVGGAKLDENISDLDIEWVSGSVNVSVYEGENVEISESAVSEDDYKLRYSVENGKLTIKPCKSGLHFKIKKTDYLNKDLTVKIPSSFVNSLKETEIDCTSADIKITDISCDKLSVETVSGKVKAENIKTALFDGETVSGDIDLTGEISELETDSTSGKVTVNTTANLNKFEVDSVSGDVELTIPETNGFKLEFSSVSGDFNSNVPIVQRGSNRIYGNGSAEFEFSSVSGDITINTAK